MTTSSWNRVEIDLGALRYNLTQIKTLVGAEVEIMAVVKSDAYGHGLVSAARAFSEAGAGIFGVAEVEEGVRLREAGIAGKIVVLLGVGRQGVADAVAYDLSPVVYDLETIRALSVQAAKAGHDIGVHLKIDVGMGRLGIMPHELDGFLEVLAGLPYIHLAGFLSHLPKADVRDDNSTQACRAVFAEFIERLDRASLRGHVAHIANSAALMRMPAARFDMVRPGISLYGCSPADWLPGNCGVKLRPALSFKSSVIQLKEVPAGFGVSYGHRFITERPTRLAVLPVGYADGYLRRLARKAEVLVAGRRAPIRGMICMNACMADVTDLPEVVVGDEVVLLGRQGEAEITADEIAEWSQTINYEILCLLGAANRQVYIDSDASQA
ncbi:MAG: alanine racemase [Desulfobulbaceae bacterium]|nr:alanine racemase [Desulfobulbaceae bacterium]HIJ79566.1 alanine racemase [Deltaproteobacteria bacterium]